MNDRDLEKRIKELELELSDLKSGNIAETLQKEISFRQAIEKSIPSGIAVIDDTGKQVYVNQSFCGLVGWEEEELLNKYPPFIYWPEGTIESVNIAFLQTLKNNAPKEGFDLVFGHKTGKLIPVHLLISPFIQENNKTFWLANVIDISDRKLANEALRESEQKFNDIVTNLDEGFYSCTLDGLILDCNLSFKRILGLGPNHDMKGVKISDFWQDPVKRLVYLDKLMKEGIIRNYLVDSTTFSGDKIAVMVNSHLVKDEARKIVKIEGTLADFTELKEADAEIKRKNEELLKLNTEKDKYFSIIAHDLRSPFNAFLGFTRMLVEELDNMTIDEIKSIVVSMRKSATNLYGLLENLLAWSMQQRGITPFNPVPVPLALKIKENNDFNIGASQRKALEIRYDIPDDLSIFADEHMFESVIHNLFTNAVKFTPRGRNVTFSAKNSEDGFIEIKVRDTGIGMKKELMDKLFKFDEQTGRKGTDGEPSTGLGLILCKDFIEKHGGKIWLESEEGKGSTFYFTMPAAK